MSGQSVLAGIPVFPTRSALASRYLDWVGSPFPHHWPVLRPVLALLAISAIFRWTNLDLWISACFYDPHTRSWPYFFSHWCTLFYRGGVYPAIGIASWAGFLTLCGWLAPNRRDWLRAGAYLLIVFAVGPGLIINTAFKQHWGRPRPHQLKQFGGKCTFAPVGTPGQLGNHNSSFPSGHASVAFYLIAPAFVASRRRPRLAVALLCVGLVFGTCMGATRVVQGGHFASDVVWSAGIVYLTCVGFAHLLLNPRFPEAAAQPTVEATQSYQMAA